jgi:hypothetical protein
VKQWKPVAVGAAVIAAATATFIAPRAFDSRSVRPLPLFADGKAAPPFDPKESAALFVGVRKFAHGDTAEVPYAVDDAVDLAYLFAFEPGVSLVPPERVVLALSGKPQKEESKRHLLELEHAGARVERADTGSILTLLQQQSALAGRAGIFILSLATHGFIRDGEPYILGESSLFQYPGTAQRTAELFDIAATSPAQRSLIFVDACRNRLTDKTRGPDDPSSAAPSLEMIRRMRDATGQVVFYAAGAGQYAYDDKGNGVFTKAVLDGLRCRAGARTRLVTVSSLSRSVEKQVRSWIRVHRQPPIGSAIQVDMDGGTFEMPLSCCGAGCNERPAPGPIRAASKDSVVTVTTTDGKPLWQHDVGAAITELEVADLDGDGPQEVVVGARNTAAGEGQLLIFDRNGKSRGAVTEHMRLRTIAVDDLFRNGQRQVVALWNDEVAASSRLSIYDGSGQGLSKYEYRGELQYATVDRPTRRHAPKVVVTGVDEQGVANVFVLDPKEVEKPVWYGSIEPRTESLQRLDVVADTNNDNKRDISIATTSGNILILDFQGDTIGRSKKRRTAPDARFELLPKSVGAR